MCKVVVIIKRFRELSLACLYTAVLSDAQPALATGSGKMLAELWRNTYPVGIGIGDALAETSCENLCARAWVEAWGHARLCRGKADETERLRTWSGEAWRHRRRRFSLSGNWTNSPRQCCAGRVWLGATACARP